MSGGDENSGKDMGRVIAHCKAFHKATGALVLLIHHSGKDDTKGARGWSGTRGAFLELVLENVLGDDARFTLNALVTESNGNMATMVAQTPFSIDYASLNVLPRLREAGGKSLSVNGVKDDIENVIDGSYPISRPLNVATVGEPTGDAKVFIDFLLSSRGQQIVEEAGYLAVK